MSHPLPFIDLGAQRDRIRDRIDAAIARVVDHGAFILGPEVTALEAELSRFAGLAHTVSCSSGADALLMPLMAWDIGPGDAVFVPTFTFAATAEMVALRGASPVFVDVDADTFNLSVTSLKAAIEAVKAKGELTPRAVIAVDLFGLIADYPAIQALCREHGLKLISDAAQGFGATLDGHQSGRWADVVCTSFFPAKPLGCYGDGGAILTDDAELVAALRSIRVHGQGEDKYDNVRLGLTARLDTIQAAILLEKLAIFPSEIEARERIAARYNDALGGLVGVPRVPTGMTSTWAQYTVLLEKGTRERVAAHLKAEGVPTAIYYTRPLHRQTAYRSYPVAPGGTPVSDDICGRVISLPMHPYLGQADQDRVVHALSGALGSRAAA
jgi:dTDP-4-amino-4,6-dideoxygalactose transaminase